MTFNPLLLKNYRTEINKSRGCLCKIPARSEVFLFVIGLTISLLFGDTKANQQPATIPITLNAVTPEELKINITSGATSVSIAGNTLTITISYPLSSLATPIKPLSNKTNKNTENNYSQKSRWWMPNWSAFADLVQTGTALGPIGILVSAGSSILYQNRHHKLVNQMVTLLTNLINRWGQTLPNDNE